MYRHPIQKLTLTLLLLGAGTLAVWGQSTHVDAASLVRPAGSAGNVQYNNTSGIGGSPNLHWDNSNASLLVGQPSSGTARIVVKGSNTSNTTFVFQGFDSGDTERSRITNGGYFQGMGLGRLGFDYGSAFALDARLYQPTSVISTATSGSTALVSLAGGFAPTSGNAIVNLVEVVGTVNQNGGANGRVRMLYLAANAVNAPNLWALETVGGYSLIGNGAVTPEIMPRLAVVGLGNTTSTSAFGVYNTSGTPLFLVGDDGQAGIGNAAPAYSLDITGNDAVRLPKGTTAQRPTNSQGIFRFNTTDSKFEGYDGSSWLQFGAGGGSASIEITEFADTGLHYLAIPAWAKEVEIVLAGGGGGGGSGRRGATSTNRMGGGGGGGAGVALRTFDVDQLADDTLAIYVGPGGSGGTTIGIDDTNGNPGNAGANSYLLSNATYRLIAGGGNGGGGGTTSGTIAGGVAGGPSSSVAGTRAGHFNGSAGGTSTTGGGQNAANSGGYGAGGGGGGGILNGAGNPSTGGSGGWGDSPDGTTLSNGGAQFSAGSAGGAGFSQTYSGYGGGGGGGGVGTAPGGAGGNGYRGSGGGGGGGCNNGAASGQGGQGGNGYARVIFRG